jgi:hypothetical protein
MEIMPNQQVGNFTFIKYKENQKTGSSKPRIVVCKCVCGKIIEKTIYRFIKNNEISCGCLSFKRKDYINKKFGTVTVTKNLEDIISNGVRIRIVEGVCDCGSVKKYRLNVIRYIKSCGCKTNYYILSKNVTHGLTSSRIYRIWQNMKNRCYNKNTKSYLSYGILGTRVCDEWIKSFDSFYNWAIRNGYSDKLTIDRIDPFGNYEPNNCRFISYKKQANNKRKTKRFLVKGEELTMAEICDKYNLDYYKASRAFKVLNWDINDVINENKFKKK